MKPIFFTLIFSISFFCSEAQKSREELIEWQKQFGDEWYNARVDSMLQEGDAVPNFALGTVRNNYTHATNLKDLRGKLVILDMWSTYCKACMAAWPRIERLQRELDKEYPGKVQIFLFNPFESSQDIDERLRKQEKGGYVAQHFPGGQVKMPDLPSIEGRRDDLLQLFPVRGVPHHIWIDGNGILRVAGSEVNTCKEKIEELLSGKELSHLKNNNSAPIYKQPIPYYQLLGKAIDAQGYNSFFAPYNHNVQAYSESIFMHVIDSTAKTVRNTFINSEVAAILRMLFFKELEEQRHKLVLALPKDYLGFFKLYVRDSSKYTDAFIKHAYKTVEDYVRSRICYEQVVHMTMSEEKQKEHILKDMNDYFGRLYGMQASWEKREIRCYALVRTSKEARLKLKVTDAPASKKEYTTKGAKVIAYTFPVSAIVADAFTKVSAKDLFTKTEDSNPGILLDESNFPKGNVSMTLPVTGSFSQLKQALRGYGFDIVEVERAFNYVVIQEKDYPFH